MISKYSIVTVDGQAEAEKLLNETVNGTTDLVQSHIYLGRTQQNGEQENVMMEMPVMRFTFIFRTS